jgi:hypothetical protein
VLEQYRTRAESLRHTLHSARYSPIPEPRVFVLIRHAGRHHLVVFDPVQDKVESKDELAVLNLIRCEIGEERAGVAVRDILRAADRAVQVWCEHREVDLTGTERVCALYLQPLDRARDLGLESTEISTIFSMTSGVSGGNTYYCSPCYYVSAELAEAYRTVTVAQRSLLLDPFDVGRITDDERHNITYSPSGDFPTLHSEPRSFEHSFRGAGERAPRLKPLRVTLDMVSEFAEELFHVAGTVVPNGTEEERSNRTDVQFVQVMLGRVFKTS